MVWRSDVGDTVGKLRVDTWHWWEIGDFMYCLDLVVAVLVWSAGEFVSGLADDVGAFDVVVVGDRLEHCERSVFFQGGPAGSHGVVCVVVGGLAVAADGDE